MDVVISVGMGPGQVDFIKRLKSFGYKVAAFGKGINAKEAIEILDYSNEIDTRDIEGAISWIDSLNVNVIAVGSYAGGQAVRTVQTLANYYHTATAIPQDLIVSGDKEEQQKLYEKYQLSTIKTWNFSELTEEFLESETASDYIIKPKIGRGSENIRVLNRNELLNLIRYKKEIASNQIVQELKKGNEYRCVMMIQGGIEAFGTYK